jgi:hypothetical protein
MQQVIKIIVSITAWLPFLMQIYAEHNRWIWIMGQRCFGFVWNQRRKGWRWSFCFCLSDQKHICRSSLLVICRLDTLFLEAVVVAIDAMMKIYDGNSELIKNIRSRFNCSKFSAMVYDRKLWLEHDEELSRLELSLTCSAPVAGFAASSSSHFEAFARLHDNHKWAAATLLHLWLADIVSLLAQDETRWPVEHVTRSTAGRFREGITRNETNLSENKNP